MRRESSRKSLVVLGWILLTAIVSAGAYTPVAFAGPHVEFDFMRVIECRDVTSAERAAQYPTQRLVELTLPVSVRFRDLSPDEVDELTIEISGASAGLRVHCFEPATKLTSDVTNGIATTTTTKKARSLDGTLGGQLPLPYAEVAANVSPSISAGVSSGKTVTETLNRLPPKQAVVVSGTSAEGRGVFFKLKRSSQTSLEGVHELSVTFVVPAGWRGAHVQVGCSARGERKLLWVIKQDATLGSEGDSVRLYLAGRPMVRQVAKPVVVDAEKAAPATTTAPKWITSRGVAADEVARMVKGASVSVKKKVEEAGSEDMK
jgi:hypothetical protein